MTAALATAWVFDSVEGIKQRGESKGIIGFVRRSGATVSGNEHSG